MPKLLLFAPCNQAIVGQDNSLSLIVIMNEVKIAIGRNTPDPIPNDALVNLRWMAVSHWMAQPEDEDQKYEQKVELIDIENRSLPGMSSTTEFALPKKRHTVVVGFNHWAAVPNGVYTLRLSLHKLGEEQWQVAAEYPIDSEMTREAAAPLALQHQ